MLNHNAAASTTPAAAASNAAALQQAREARQGKAATKAARKAAKAQQAAAKPAYAGAAVAGWRNARPVPPKALVQASNAATVRRNAPVALPATKAAAKAVQAVQAKAGPVTFVARRHNVQVVGGTAYHYRKVATGTWVVQVGTAATAAGAPAYNAPVVGKAANLRVCATLAAAHAASAKLAPAKAPKAAKGKAPAAKPAPEPAQGNAPAAPDATQGK